MDTKIATVSQLDERIPTPSADHDRFAHAMQHLVKVPKKLVDDAMKVKSAGRKVARVKANG